MSYMSGELHSYQNTYSKMERMLTYHVKGISSEDMLKQLITYNMNQRLFQNYIFYPHKTWTTPASCLSHAFPNGSFGRRIQLTNNDDSLSE